MVSLESVWSKFEWARSHLRCLDRQITSYVKSVPSEIVADAHSTFDSQGIEWKMVRVKLLTPVPNDIPLILGDVVTNLRSCLDYLVWELVKSNGGTPGAKSCFPICATEKSFKSAERRGDLEGVSSEARSFIQSLQPYHLEEKAHESYLWALHDFTNINKHRRLLVTQLTTAAVPDDPNFIKMIDGQAHAFLNPPRIGSETEFGPFIAIDGVVQGDARFMAYVSFNEATAKGFEVLSFLAPVFDFVAGTIERCQR